MSPDVLNTWRSWKAEHPEFPLTVHPCGQWSKKIRGAVHYFGPLAEPAEALKNWDAEKSYLLVGMTPPTYAAGMTVGELLDEFLEDFDGRVEAGKASKKTRWGFAALKQIFTNAGLLNVQVNLLGPQQFSAVQRIIEDGRSLNTQKTVISLIRTVFNWGKEMGLTQVPQYGPRFVLPSVDEIDAEREEAGRERFVSRETILACLKAASPSLKVAILFGINCGFYPSDSVAITMNHLHLGEKYPYHDFRRPKTKRRRMAALWPETVDAICDYMRIRAPQDKNERRLLVTQYGEPYGSGGIRLQSEFRDMLKDMSLKTEGVGIGSLRHTYATVIDSVPDQSMIDLTMGHAGKSLQKRVYRQMNLDELPRLKAVSDAARGWLYEKENTAKVCA